MGFDKWTTGDIAVEGDLNQLIAAWEGEAAAGQPFQCVEVDDATKYAGDFKNKNASGLALRAKDNAGNDIFDATKDKVKISKTIELAAGIKAQRLVQFESRQGGHATDWDTGGVTDYSIADMRLRAELGAYQVQTGGASGGSFPVAFDTAFAHIPIVSMWTMKVSAGFSKVASVYLTEITVSGFSVYWKLSEAVTATLVFGWLAIGAGS